MKKPHLVSFADGAFKSRRPVFERMARASGFFSQIHVHGLESLEKEFQNRHARYMLETARGFGHWIWKPKVIQQTLASVSSDDMVLYLDAGFTLNSHAKARFVEYVEIASSHPSKMLSFMNIFTEAHWTKADLFARVGFSLSCLEAKTSQLGSGFIIVGNTVQNRELVDEWGRIAIEENYHFSDDSDSVLDNHPLFQEHRHDQSISSLLRKQHGTAVTHYEVQGYEGRFERIKKTVPTWATRSRT
ncbi:hypothetical protein [Nioella sp.]|uniref:hypothetical protein n=1 Tax=Nioella sp. TaxID=1912091 RepID=UPI003B51A0B6